MVDRCSIMNNKLVVNGFIFDSDLRFIYLFPDAEKYYIRVYIHLIPIVMLPIAALIPPSLAFFQRRPWSGNNKRSYVNI